jgi:hypothetical protein
MTLTSTFVLRDDKLDAKRDNICHFIWLMLLMMKVWDDMLLMMKVWDDMLLMMEVWDGIRHFIWLILLRCELRMPSSEKVFVRVLVE